MWEGTKTLISMPENNSMMDFFEFIQGLGNATLISILIISFLSILYLRQIEKIEKDKEIGRIVTNMNDGLLTVSNGLITFANTKLFDILTLKPEELINQKIEKLIGNNPNSLLVQFFENESEKSISNIEIELGLGKKDKIPVLASASRLIDGKRTKKIDEILLIFTDIRQLRSAQDQIKDYLHIEKIAALNHVSQRIGHEINNPLAFLLLDLERQQELYKEMILMLKLYDQVNKTSDSTEEDTQEIIDQLEEMKDKLDFDETLVDLEEILMNAKDGLRKIAQVVKEIRAFPTMEDSTGKLPYSLNKIVKLTINMARNQVENRIEITEELDPNLPFLPMNGGRVAQGILNLIFNSIQAIDNIGKIRIKTYLEDFDKKNKFICLSVEDNGHGIKDEHIPYIFNPYFTSKKEGTGLGLTIVKNIIDDHNGKIETNSILNKGTEMILKFPITIEDN
jgi:two-component system nitrogen regulation sensor histidine kinase NtrY